MKRLFLISSILCISSQLFSQGSGNNSNWKIDGNTINTGEFLGTTNFQDLVFKTNGNEGLRLDVNGNFRIGSLIPGSPLEKFSLNGNMIASGNIAANGLSVVNFVKSDKGVLLNSAFCFEGNNGSAGSTNRMWSMNGDMYIQSNNSYGFNTILNNSNTGLVGVGTNTPQ
ncbi:MAG: hypothetical protein ACI837_003168 [Crocinitomicaceae bacterium]|jgi:hypothetical protein